MSDCIFCKIIAGEIPASKVYEDEQVLAFLDISQVTPGHTLVVPKEHYRNLLEMDATSASQLFAQVPKVAQKVMKATNAAGMNIIANCEEIEGKPSFIPTFTSCLATVRTMTSRLILSPTNLTLTNLLKSLKPSKTHKELL